MTPTPDVVATFRALHDGPGALLMPNAWDLGSARLFASLGFKALATTSSGHAATLGRHDGGVTRDEAIAHGAAMADAVAVPVSADFEDCFARSPDDVADTVARAAGTGLAGCSVEDFTRDRNDPIYELGLAVDRVRAAVDAAAGRLVLTARAENLLHGRVDLGDTIRRLQAFQDAGADVLFAPGLVTVDDIRAVVTSVDRPVNVLAGPGRPTVAELAALGVRRISVGGSFAWVALSAAADAARELLEHGTYGYGPRVAEGRDAFRAAVDR